MGIDFEKITNDELLGIHCLMQHYAVFKDAARAGEVPYVMEPCSRCLPYLTRRCTSDPHTLVSQFSGIAGIYPSIGVRREARGILPRDMFKEAMRQAEEQGREIMKSVAYACNAAGRIAEKAKNEPSR